MPDISSVGHGSLDPLSRPGSVSTFQNNGFVRESGAIERGDDRVELSEHSRFLDLLRQLPEGRDDRVQQVRHAIATGTYETEEKLGQAISRLIEDLDD